MLCLGRYCAAAIVALLADKNIRKSIANTYFDTTEEKYWQ